MFRNQAWGMVGKRQRQRGHTGHWLLLSQKALVWQALTPPVYTIGRVENLECCPLHRSVRPICLGIARQLCVLEIWDDPFETQARCPLGIGMLRKCSRAPAVKVLYGSSSPVAKPRSLPTRHPLA